jgi:hypothetical protein
MQKHPTVNAARLMVGTILAVTVVSCTSTHPSRQLWPPDGNLWLSWSQSERRTYMFGMLEGYGAARHDACLTADQLFEVGQPHRLGDETHPTEVPSGRCLAATDTYSHFQMSDFSEARYDSYVNEVTEFYTRYPKYRKVLFPLLFDHLRDRNFKTVDQLAAMAEAHVFDLS